MDHDRDMIQQNEKETDSSVSDPKSPVSPHVLEAASEAGEEAGEKTRFGIIPPHITRQMPRSGPRPAATDYEPSESSEPQGTRFGLIPPTVIEKTGVHRGQTGQFEFDATKALTPEMQEHRLAHHVPPAKGWGMLLRAKLPLFFTLLFIVVAGICIPFYFVPYLLNSLGREIRENERYEEAITQTQQSVPGSGTTVRFFGIPATGQHFVFLIGRSSRMNSGSTPSPLSIVKRELLQTLKALTETDQFNVVFFNTRTVSASVPEEEITLLPATIANREMAENFIAGVTAEGQADPEQALSKAINANPHVLFFVCDTLDVSSVSARQWDEIAHKLSGIDCVIIELGFGREPLRGTTLKSLASRIKAGYLWKNTYEEVPGSRPQQSVNRSADESSDNQVGDSVKKLIAEDFTPQRIQMMLTAPEYTPFGRGFPVQVEKAVEFAKPPKLIPLSNTMIEQIEADARLVYMSGFPSVSGLIIDSRLLKQGAETRLGDWVKGANAELPAGEYLIGLCYKNGVRIEPDDAKAFQCFLKSALGGCAPAMSQLGNYYMFGALAVPVSIEKARFWIERAARLGEPVAQTLMGSRYSTNPAEKAGWYEQAAKLGYHEAEFLYARCLETGEGKTQDIFEALTWYDRAAIQDHFGAKQAIRRLQAPTPESKQEEKQ